MASDLDDVDSSLSCFTVGCKLPTKLYHWQKADNSTKRTLCTLWLCLKKKRKKTELVKKKVKPWTEWHSYYSINWDSMSTTITGITGENPSEGSDVFSSSWLHIWVYCICPATFPHYLIQRNTKLWSVDSEAPLFVQVSKTYGCTFDITTTKLIIKMMKNLNFKQLFMTTTSPMSVHSWQ